MSKEEKKVNRRDFLFTASYTIGAVGVGAVIWPMIDQMNPDRAQHARSWCPMTSFSEAQI